MIILSYILLSTIGFFLPSATYTNMNRATTKVNQALSNKASTMIMPATTTQVREFKIPPKYKFWKSAENQKKEEVQQMITENNENTHDISGATCIIKHTVVSTPEYTALQHFANTQAPSGPPVTLSDDPEKIQVSASYYPLLCLIRIGKEFHQKPPSQKYALLLHEYRHRLQHLNQIYFDSTELTKEQKKFYPQEILIKAQQKSTQKQWKPYEQDADHFAASHITCPTCLKVTQTCHPSSNSDGYFTEHDIEPFIVAAQQNPCCPAHSKTPGDDEHNLIVEELEKTLLIHKKARLRGHDHAITWELDEKSGTLQRTLSYMKAWKLDEKSGTLLQHIPEYNRDLMRRIAQDLEFQARLAATTLKDIDVRKQLEQTEQDIKSGKYKLLEAPKPLIAKTYTRSGN